MPERTFQDSKGVEWLVYDCAPSPGLKAGFAREFQSGWLCFQSAAEKRRLVDYPPDWEKYSATRLEALLRTAAVVSWVSPATGSPRFVDDPTAESGDKPKKKE